MKKFAIIFASVLIFSLLMLEHNVYADTVVDTIQIGTPGTLYPLNAAVDPNTNLIYVGQEGPSANGIFVINGTSNSVDTITIGSAGSRPVVNPNTNMIYVLGGPGVIVINGSSREIVSQITIKDVSGGIAVNPDTDKVYVGDYPAGIDVIDGATNKIISTIPIGNVFANNIAVNPATNMIYVTSNPSSRLVIIDGTTNRIVDNGIVFSQQPFSVAVNPITDKIYVSAFPHNGSHTSYTFIIDGTTNNIITSIPNATADEIGINPATNKIYIPNDSNNTLDIIDGSTDTVSSTITVGCGCGFDTHAAAVNPLTNMIYVVNGHDNTVSIVQGSSPQSTTSQLQINSQDSFGNTITGFHTELYAQNGTQLDDGYTPVNFSLYNGQSYTVSVDDYGKYQFNHWQDTGSTDENRTISISSDESITAVYATVPTHPSNLAATAVSSSEIDLNWNAPTNDGGSPITGYKIQSSTDGTTWSTIVKNTGTTDTTYSDTGLAHSTTYYYRVFALNSVGQSTRSNIVSATTFNIVPSAPTGLTATANLLQIDLSWNAPSDNGGTPITGYVIERSTDNGSTWSTIVSNSGSTGTTYSDTNVLPLTTYTYRVSAINDIGTGESSNTASATTPSVSVPPLGGTTVGPVTPPSVGQVTVP